MPNIPGCGVKLGQLVEGQKLNPEHDPEMNPCMNYQSGFSECNDKKVATKTTQTCKGHDTVVSLSAGNDMRPAEAK